VPLLRVGRVPESRADEDRRPGTAADRVHHEEGLQTMSRWTNPHHGVSHLCDLPVGIQATVEVFDESPHCWTEAYVLSRSSPQPFTPIVERLFDEPGHTDAAKRWLEEWVRLMGGRVRA
jgi:hypothetical protein